MSSGKLIYDRELVDDCVTEVFGTPLAIDERVYKALAFGLPSQFQAFGVALSAAEPNIGHRLTLATYGDFFLEHYGSAYDEPIGKGKQYDAWTRESLVAFFRGNFRLHPELEKLNDAATEVSRRRRLTCDDFVLSEFEQGVRWLWLLDKLEAAERFAPGERVVIAQRTNEQRNVFAGTTADFLDPSHGDQQWILYFDGTKYRIRPFGVWGGFQLEEAPLKDGTIFVVRGNVLDPVEYFSPDAIAFLEELVNAGASEKDFQTFFEQHPEFLLALGGGQYSRLHAQLVLHEESGSSLIPDFFLEKVNSHFCDICDLKRPTEALAKHQRHRQRFRNAVFEAVAQLEGYRNWFEDRAHREEFRHRYGLNSYRPKVVVIIGRRLDYYQDIERIRTEGILPEHFVLKTYDDVIDEVRNYVSIASRMVLPRSDKSRR